jgi:hypothetical protein
VNIHYRVTETHVANASLKYRATLPSGTATISKIKQELPTYIDLSEADRAISDTRPNEQVWEQLLRNIVSHRGSNGNFIFDGLLEYEPRRLRITDAGRSHLQKMM